MLISPPLPSLVDTYRPSMSSLGMSIIVNVIIVIDLNDWNIYDSNLVMNQILALNTLEGINIVIYKALCFDVAQGRMNGRPMRLEFPRVGLLV